MLRLTSVESLKKAFTVSVSCVAGILASSSLCLLLPLRAEGNGYVDEGPGDAAFELRSGEVVQTDLGGKVVKRLGKAQPVSPDIVKVGSTYYCKWKGFAETQVKKFGAKRWRCTPRGIEAHPTPWPQVADSPSRPNTSYSLGPAFSGRALTKQGWTKPVTHQAVLKTMKSGKNLYGHGLVQMQLVSRQYALWVQVNCSTRDWKYLDHDVYLMGGVQEDFGRVDTDGLGKWACSKAGFRY